MKTKLEAIIFVLLYNLNRISGKLQIIINLEAGLLPLNKTPSSSLLPPSGQFLSRPSSLLCQPSRHLAVGNPSPSLTLSLSLEIVWKWSRTIQPDRPQKTWTRPQPQIFMTKVQARAGPMTAPSAREASQMHKP